MEAICDRRVAFLRECMMDFLKCPACRSTELGAPYLSGGIVYSTCTGCQAEIEMTPVSADGAHGPEFGVLKSLESAPSYKTGRYRLLSETQPLRQLQ